MFFWNFVECRGGGFIAGLAISVLYRFVVLENEVEP